MGSFVFIKLNFSYGGVISSAYLLVKETHTYIGAVLPTIKYENIK